MTQETDFELWQLPLSVSDVEAQPLNGDQQETGGRATGSSLGQNSYEDNILRYRDAFGRPTDSTAAAGMANGLEMFIDPADGRIRQLQVQRAIAPLNKAAAFNSSSWKCRDLCAADVPKLIALTNFCYHSKRLVIFYLPAVFLMTMYLLVLCPIELELDNQGRYDAVLYRNWKKSALAKNLKENEQFMPPAQRATDKRFSDSDEALRQHVVGGEEQLIPYSSGFISRRPMPRFLCFVDDIDLSNLGPNDEVAREIKEDEFEDYIFVSYTRTQFWTGGADIQSHRNRVALLEIGIRAARDAGLGAFWVDCFPLVDIQADKEDVYRICDIVKAAHSLVVALDPSKIEGDVLPSTTVSTDDRGCAARSGEVKAIRGWGSRLWVLPELLLSASHRDIVVYNHSSKATHQYSKHRLGSLAWRTEDYDWTANEDWSYTSQLLDHYEGTIHLSPLELIYIAYTTLRRKPFNPRKPGDIAYCLMGLLRRRPQIVHDDTEFMAFARLSLSNNNDAIIERLICMQPPSNYTPWWQMVDSYGAKLYDIEPLCQVAAIGEGLGTTHPQAADEDAHVSKDKKKRSTDTVVLDGAYGASICWSRLDTIPFMKRNTRIRQLTTSLLPKAPFFLILGGLVIGVFAVAVQTINQSSGSDPTSIGDLQSQFTTSALGLTGFCLAAGSLLVAGSLCILIAGPALLRNIYYGKFWSTQARFYGIQGYCGMEELERSLFGLYDKRLKWSTNTSLKSHPVRAADGDFYEGADPNQPCALDERDAEGNYLFTLVDTYVLEVSVFYAPRPPSVVMICGREGGMLRAVLCSYDWQRQTFCREAVLRMKSIILNRMERVDKFRFAFRREFSH